MLRRRYGTFQWLRVLISLPATQMLPASGSCSLVRRRRKVDLPEPDGPTMKTNSPLAMSTEQSRRATVVPLYDLVTWSRRIMGRSRVPVARFGRESPSCRRRVRGAAAGGGPGGVCAGQRAGLDGGGGGSGRGRPAVGVLVRGTDRR